LGSTLHAEGPVGIPRRALSAFPQLASTRLALPPFCQLDL
jgi:hypothetical protein